MNILIIGANGQLGQDFQKYCITNKIEFAASDLQNESKLSITNKYEQCDVKELKSVRRLILKHQYSHIINCCAYNKVDIAETDWGIAYSVNGLGPKFISLAANDIGAEIIHFSTDYVFEGNKGEGYTVFDTPNPINKYGESKLLGERFIRDVANKYYIIRVSWVFGLGNINFVKKVIEWSIKQKTISLTKDETSAPSYTFDIVKATMKLIHTRALGLYHVTNSSCSRYEWGKYILEKIGWIGELFAAKRSDFNLPAARPEYSVLNNFGFYETVGWKMPSWQNATNRFLNELKNLKSFI